MCEQETETVLHAVRECTRTQEIFALCGLDSKLPQGPFNYGFQWLEEVVQMLDGIGNHCSSTSFIECGHPSLD
ncbi:hypothetical protein V6N11_047020 [Hibiscus sabdariffa]|uniref:Uncharacterized protein n=2 Tax=Hibiscus sabdariffa TaxID=183260 RepID=A0ABR2NA28_9ROSI